MKSQKLSIKLKHGIISQKIFRILKNNSLLQYLSLYNSLHLLHNPIVPMIKNKNLRNYAYFLVKIGLVKKSKHGRNLQEFFYCKNSFIIRKILDKVSLAIVVNKLYYCKQLH